MPTMTISRAKNMMRRALYGLIDPDLTKAQVREIWKFFDGQCVYCGRRLDYRKKQAHMDHLVSTSARGLNHISNRVLSCARCNEHDKRDRPWQEFLREKAGSDATYAVRKATIDRWTRTHASESTHLTPELAQAAYSKIERIGTAFDQAVSELRELNRRKGQYAHLPAAKTRSR